MKRLGLAVVLAAFLAWIPEGPTIAQDLPSASDLLFETPDWQLAAPGTALHYRYERRSALSSERLHGFSDTIRLLVAPGSTADSRHVQVEMFSGPQRRSAGPFDDVSSNPVIVLFLEHHLQALARTLGASPSYLKNAIRAGLRDKVSIVPSTADYGGRPVPAWRIETQPFLDDPRRGRMMGFDRLTYTFVASDRVPGRILAIETRADAADGRMLLQEVLRHDSRGD